MDILLPNINGSLGSQNLILQTECSNANQRFRTTFPWCVFVLSIWASNKQLSWLWDSSLSAMTLISQNATSNTRTSIDFAEFYFNRFAHYTPVYFCNVDLPVRRLQLSPGNSIVLVLTRIMIVSLIHIYHLHTQVRLRCEPVSVFQSEELVPDKGFLNQVSSVFGLCWNSRLITIVRAGSRLF